MPGRLKNAQQREDEAMAKHKFFREVYPPAAGTGSPTALTQPGDFDMDLNSASLEQLSRVPLLGPERARALIEARPFTHWRQVRHLPDFTDATVDDLKKGGARLG
jgi:DNA uptake protein ComE-like DNA-binding protein